MKKQVYSLFIFLFITMSVSAQQKGRANCISQMGYWVIESNKHTKLQSTVYFYTQENTLVYTEKVDGVKININKRKTLLKLKTALEQAIVAWQKGQKESNNVLVFAKFKN